MSPFFDKEPLIHIREHLMAHKETIATAESVTAGLLQAALSTAPDAALFFQGGITAYTLEQKVRHLHVDAIHAAACNCVSERVAEEMAMNACRLFSCHWAISVTGYATPVPEGGNRLYACYCIVHRDVVAKNGLLTPNRADEPFNIQHWYANQLLLELSGVMALAKRMAGPAT